MITRGCSAFRPISLNVEKEEGAMKEDSGMQDVPYNEVTYLCFIYIGGK